MKNLVDYLSKRLDLSNKSLIEKDVILHRLLHRLTQDAWFRQCFAFKGGTCLTKCYLGYYRFSEDLDFTYTPQHEFSDASQKEIRRVLSGKINRLLRLLTHVSEELDLDFSGIKSDSRYVEIGGSNKFVTFKLWYRSQVLGLEQFVKIQVNFVELLAEKIVKRNAASLYAIPGKEMELMYPEYMDLLSDVSLRCYSLEEIFFEKVRAILTRRGFKSRDFVDAFLIRQNVHIDYKEKAVEKVLFMLHYDKYIQNLALFEPEKVILGDEERLMLIPLEKGFTEFLKGFSRELKEILQEVTRHRKHST